MLVVGLSRKHCQQPSVGPCTIITKPSSVHVTASSARACPPDIGEKSSAAAFPRELRLNRCCCDHSCYYILLLPLMIVTMMMTTMMMTRMMTRMLILLLFHSHTRHHLCTPRCARYRAREHCIELRNSSARETCYIRVLSSRRMHPAPCRRREGVHGALSLRIYTLYRLFTPPLVRASTPRSIALRISIPLSLSLAKSLLTPEKERERASDRIVVDYNYTPQGEFPRLWRAKGFKKVV